MSRLDAFNVVVLDLDDTLYSEAEYVRSGFAHVGDLVERLYDKPFHALLEEARKAGANDAMAHALEAAGLPIGLKEHLILAYRYHRPTLTPHKGAMELIQGCRARGCPLYLVTDGRSVTQRLKLEALGLSHLFDAVYISDEIGRGKPDPLAFETIARRSPRGPWVYVADNPAKDFVAPNLLGWATIGVRHDGSRIHLASKSVREPDLWVDELADLL